MTNNGQVITHCELLFTCQRSAVHWAPACESPWFTGDEKLLHNEDVTDGGVCSNSSECHGKWARYCHLPQ